MGKITDAKDLAISLSLEVSELLENFQWKTNEEAIENRIENIKDELADILIYTLLFANVTDINLEKAVDQKIKKNMEKYPVDKSYGNNFKYTEF